MLVSILGSEENCMGSTQLRLACLSGRHHTHAFGKVYQGFNSQQSHDSTYLQICRGECSLDCNLHSHTCSWVHIWAISIALLHLRAAYSPLYSAEQWGGYGNGVHKSWASSCTDCCTEPPVWSNQVKWYLCSTGSVPWVFGTPKANVPALSILQPKLDLTC